MTEPVSREEPAPPVARAAALPAAVPYPAWLSRSTPCRVLVVGDPVADLWIYGVPRRISREAPVLILEYDRQEIMPGGAAHCARSLAALGGEVILAGPLGRDPWGQAVAGALARAGVRLLPAPVPPGWQTPLKARFVAAPPAAPAQQVLRLDVPPGATAFGLDPVGAAGMAAGGEGPRAWGDGAVPGQAEPDPWRAQGTGSDAERRPNPERDAVAGQGDATGTAAGDGRAGEEAGPEWRRFGAALRAAARSADAVVVADYGLSDVALRLWPQLSRWARGRPVIVDSRHRLLGFRGATLATPNLDELAEVWGRPVPREDLPRVAAAIRSRGRFAALVVTRGPEGMLVDPGDGAPVEVPAVRPTAVYDVTGAGDTVAAVLALAMGSGLDVVGAARLANLAGSLAVRKPGTRPVTAQELEEAWRAWAGEGRETGNAGDARDAGHAGDPETVPAIPRSPGDGGPGRGAGV
ncbi:PfkB domain protein [Thermaerobacter marianensis DSM 12885]|uniref:PfkB domain protein n=1 Tax=Thermaerobacter marianensis (strain ATCC 700841 / DSM 12885 / JCM 10246 / 7p75a) TaxID=644966 RepID=E6SJ73_THEM7|nr:PfkB family carbohydrate kinase [Thermaerobacter marianensis]ADU52097.1 PfkB domain protein [Thermaerobacter marianensis DSM 12885]